MGALEILFIIIIIIIINIICFLNWVRAVLTENKTSVPRKHILSYRCKSLNDRRKNGNYKYTTYGKLLFQYLAVTQVLEVLITVGLWQCEIHSTISQMRGAMISSPWYDRWRGVKNQYLSPFRDHHNIYFKWALWQTLKISRRWRNSCVPFL